MANTSPIYARIDTNLKESAEGILAKLGIFPSSAIQILSLTLGMDSLKSEQVSKVNAPWPVPG